MEENDATVCVGAPCDVVMRSVKDGVLADGGRGERGYDVQLSVLHVRVVGEIGRHFKFAVAVMMSKAYGKKVM